MAPLLLLRFLLLLLPLVVRQGVVSKEQPLKRLASATCSTTTFTLSHWKVREGVASVPGVAAEQAGNSQALHALHATTWQNRWPAGRLACECCCGTGAAPFPRGLAPSSSPVKSNTAAGGAPATCARVSCARGCRRKGRDGGKQAGGAGAGRVGGSGALEYDVETANNQPSTSAEAPSEAGASCASNIHR